VCGGLRAGGEMGGGEELDKVGRGGVERKMTLVRVRQMRRMSAASRRQCVREPSLDLAASRCYFRSCSFVCEGERDRKRERE